MLEEVKDYLKITWNDEDTMLQSLIDRGENYLNELIGITLDFEEQAQPKALLLDYCRYAYNNALEYFEKNFQSEIIRLQFQKAVEENNATNTE